MMNIFRQNTKYYRLGNYYGFCIWELYHMPSLAFVVKILTSSFQVNLNYTCPHHCTGDSIICCISPRNLTTMLAYQRGSSQETENIPVIKQGKCNHLILPNGVKEDATATVVTVLQQLRLKRQLQDETAIHRTENEQTWKKFRNV